MIYRAYFYFGNIVSNIFINYLGSTTKLEGKEKNNIFAKKDVTRWITAHTENRGEKKGEHILSLRDIVERLKINQYKKTFVKYEMRTLTKSSIFSE